MEDLRKKYNEDGIAIGIWDCSFYFVDGDGNAVSDEKGKVRIFTADDHDYSDMADRVEFDELSEVVKKEEDSKDDPDEVSFSWCTDDVMEECKWLTKIQAREILHLCKRKHDASIGMNWDVIKVHAEHLYSEGEIQL